MAVVIDKETKILIQGFTGKMGTFHADEMIKYGSNIVGGVTPGKGGQKHLDRPVFNTVKNAVQETGATASILFVPPAFAADSAMEAADAGIKTCVAIVDGIPSHDMIRIKRYMRRYSRKEKMTLVGPNCAGIISPGKSMLGIMPGHIYKEGRVGIISRSGTLGYEAAQQLKNLNIGISTSVGIGGDPINGSSFRDIIEKFETDDETDLVLMIGEIGGPQEVAAGEFAKENMKKPIVGYIAGLTAPKGRVMGHAGAIVSAYGESAVEKVELLKEFDIKPLGLEALDMVRIEAGLIFYGYEFDDQTDPFEAGIGFTVPLKTKEDEFIGKEELIKRKANPQKKLVGLELVGHEPAVHGDCVHVGRAQIGVITSGMLSPKLGKNIALCRIDIKYSEVGTEIEIGKLDGHQKRIGAKVVPFPFYDPTKSRVRA